MSGLDRWIIGALVMALSGVLWYLLLDGRSEVRQTIQQVMTNTTRISLLESRMESLEQRYNELRDDVRRQHAMNEKETP